MIAEGLSLVEAPRKASAAIRAEESPLPEASNDSAPAIIVIEESPASIREQLLDAAKRDEQDRFEALWKGIHGKNFAMDIYHDLVAMAGLPTAYYARIIRDPPVVVSCVEELTVLRERHITLYQALSGRPHPVWKLAVLHAASLGAHHTGASLKHLAHYLGMIPTGAALPTPNRSEYASFYNPKLNVQLLTGLMGDDLAGVIENHMGDIDLEEPLALIKKYRGLSIKYEDEYQDSLLQLVSELIQSLSSSPLPASSSSSSSEASSSSSSSEASSSSSSSEASSSSSSSEASPSSGPPPKVNPDSPLLEAMQELASHLVTMVQIRNNTGPMWVLMPENCPTLIRGSSLGPGPLGHGVILWVTRHAGDTFDVVLVNSGDGIRGNHKEQDGRFVPWVRFERMSLDVLRTKAQFFHDRPSANQLYGYDDGVFVPFPVKGRLEGEEEVYVTPQQAGTCYTMSLIFWLRHIWQQPHRGYLEDALIMQFVQGHLMRAALGAYLVSLDLWRVTVLLAAEGFHAVSTRGNIAKVQLRAAMAELRKQLAAEWNMHQVRARLLLSASCQNDPDMAIRADAFRVRTVVADSQRAPVEKFVVQSMEEVAKEAVHRTFYYFWSIIESEGGEHLRVRQLRLLKAQFDAAPSRATQLELLMRAIREGPNWSGHLAVFGSMLNAVGPSVGEQRMLVMAAAKAANVELLHAMVVLRRFPMDTGQPPNLVMAYPKVFYGHASRKQKELLAEARRQLHAEPELTKALLFADDPLMLVCREGGYEEWHLYRTYRHTTTPMGSVDLARCMGQAVASQNEAVTQCLAIENGPAPPLMSAIRMRMQRVKDYPEYAYRLYLAFGPVGALFELVNEQFGDDDRAVMVIAAVKQRNLRAVHDMVVNHGTPLTFPFRPAIEQRVSYEDVFPSQRQSIEALADYERSSVEGNLLRSHAAFFYPENMAAEHLEILAKVRQQAPFENRAKLDAYTAVPLMKAIESVCGTGDLETLTFLRSHRMRVPFSLEQASACYRSAAAASNEEAQRFLETEEAWMSVARGAEKSRVVDE